MAIAARTITVNLTAGTAKFFKDVDAATGKLREFGHEGVTNVQATSGALRVLEGNMTNNLRAAERFVANVLGLGPALKFAFPVVGAVALGGLLVELSSKAVEFWKSVRDAGIRSDQAFRGMLGPMRLTNDELALSNARLENQIAALEGHHENTLKATLLEAVTAADKLADSLDRDLQKLHEVLEQRKPGFFAIATGAEGAGDIVEAQDKFREHIAQITEEGNAKIRAAAMAKNHLAQEAAQVELNQRLWAAYAVELAEVRRQTEEAQNRAKNVTRFVGPSLYGISAPGADEEARLKVLAARRSALQYGQDSIDLQASNLALSGKREGLEGAAAKVDPFAKKMEELGAQLKGVNAELNAVGQSQAAQTLTKAFTEADVEIARINAALGKVGLTPAQAQAMRQAFAGVAQGKDQVEWAEKVDAATKKLRDEVQAQDLLTEAIGKGYEAVKRARVESTVMQAMGAERYNDSSNDLDAARIRGAAAAQFDAEHRERTRTAIEGLQNQIELEKALAAAVGQGAEAVRQATLAVKARQSAAAGVDQAQIQAEKDAAVAERMHATAGAVAEINERIAATERLTLAIGRGAAAVREAVIENRLASIAREGDSAVPGMMGIGAHGLAAMREAGAAYGEELAKARASADRPQALADEIQKLNEAKKALGDTLGVEIELRNLENDRLKALTEESLALGTARDGVRAFFIEMREQGVQASNVIYNTFNSMFDKTSSNLAKLITGQKTNWAKSFQETGEQAAEASVKGLEQMGLGKLGALFGVDIGGAKPDGTAGNPIWVRMADLPGGGGGGAGLGAGGSIPGIAARPGGGESPGIWGALGRLIGINPGGGGGGGGIGDLGDLNRNVATSDGGGVDLSWYGGGLAEGGDVEPGKLYQVGERGREWFAPTTHGRIIPDRGGMGGATVINNNIDARGADLGAYNRIARGLEASRRETVVAAVRAMHERSLRVPQR